jgi:hypothetical protein
VNGAAQLVRVVGVDVGVPPSRLPTNIKLELQRELDRIRSAVALIEARLAEHDDAGAANVLPDDALVDQRTVPAPRDLFLRLARRGAFRSQKHGKRVVARWGDVQRALLDASPGVRKTGGNDAANDPPQGDALDGLRQRLGLAAKGK